MHTFALMLTLRIHYNSYIILCNLLLYSELIGPVIGGGLTTLIGFQAGTSVSLS